MSILSNKSKAKWLSIKMDLPVSATRLNWNIPVETSKLNVIKYVLLAVAQSRSLHVVHEAYFCESCIRDAIYQHFKE